MEKPEVKFLCKYRAINEQNLDALENSYVFCPAPEHLNDPYDCRPQLNERVTRGELVRFVTAKRGSHSREAFADALRRIRQVCGKKMFADARSYPALKNAVERFRSHFSNLGVGSLSANPRSELMWAHYTSKHHGYCLEFVRRPDNIFGNDQCYKVSYSREWKEVRIASILLDEVTATELTRLTLTTKRYAWRYEDEWRLLAPEPNMQVPYESSDIRRIIFGFRTTPDEVKEVISRLPRKTEVAFARLSDDDQGIRIEE